MSTETTNDNSSGGDGTGGRGDADEVKRRLAILKELRDNFVASRDKAQSKSTLRGWLATLLVFVAALGSAFAGAAVATTGSTVATTGSTSGSTTTLSTSWRTAIIIVAFLATGIAAGAAALRPTDRAQAAAVERANAEALVQWTDFLIFRVRYEVLESKEFNRAINWLQTWRINQLKAEPYTYSGKLPWD